MEGRNTVECIIHTEKYTYGGKTYTVECIHGGVYTWWSIYAGEYTHNEIHIR